MVGSFIASKFYPTNNKIDQPIEYSHNKHIEGVGLKCIYCHSNYDKTPSATIPQLKKCKGCHGEKPLSKSPEEKKLINFIKKGEEIPWRKIYRLPDHVYFSHRRHVILGEIKCFDCHGNIEEKTEPITSPFIELTMENCLNCHIKNKITNDCLSCHH